MLSDTDTIVPEIIKPDYERLMRLRNAERYPLSLNEALPVLDLIHVELLEIEPPKADNATSVVITLDPDPLLKEKLADKDKRIQELTAKLNEFERTSWFEFDGLDLPDDYYENDTHSDL